MHVPSYTDFDKSISNNIKVKGLGVWSCSDAFPSRPELQFTLLLQVRKEIAYWSGDKEN